ncbi:ComF family protein [Desulfothermobacter acidiphilus]|uniref:ComF family protein n=1 Tax=Desulfothermobacter acidiphilus TaxID=1938353 RepID=UPI003F8BD198
MDLLFPLSGCCLCGEESEEGSLCSTCQDFLRRAATLSFCPRCGRFGRGETCSDCWISPPSFILCRALGPYEGPLQRAVHRLKYGGKREGVEYLGRLLAELVAGNAAYAGVQVVVPVPTTLQRRKERGFDQAELLAKELARELGLPLDCCLEKTGSVPQTGLSRAERRRISRSSFRLRSAIRFPGSAVLLVDDVLTTGSSLAAASRVLLAGGAAEVSGVVLAAARIIDD